MKYQKTAEATGYLSANKIANKVTKVSRRSPQNYSYENDKTKNWVEINHGSYGVYNAGRPIKFRTSMIRSSLCH